MNVSLLKETMLMNKGEFCLKVVFLLVILRTYWVMCYTSILSLLEARHSFRHPAKYNKPLLGLFEVVKKMKKKWIMREQSKLSSKLVWNEVVSLNFEEVIAKKVQISMFS